MIFAGQRCNQPPNPEHKLTPLRETEAYKPYFSSLAVKNMPWRIVDAPKCSNPVFHLSQNGMIVALLSIINFLRLMINMDFVFPCKGQCNIYYMVVENATRLIFFLNFLYEQVYRAT